MSDELGTDLDQLFPQCGERPVFGLLRQRQCPLRVITGPGRPRPAASVVRGRADLQVKKADVAARRSALGGRAVGPATWPEPPLIAITGLNGDLAILDAKLKADEALALIGGRTAVDEPAGP